MSEHGLELKRVTALVYRAPCQLISGSKTSRDIRLTCWQIPGLIRAPLPPRLFSPRYSAQVRGSPKSALQVRVTPTID